jgi:hypothetical protein
MPIPVNGKPPLGYRIGTTDRELGADASDHPEGFLVINTTNNTAFVVAGGVWTSGVVDNTLIAAWKLS